MDSAKKVWSFYFPAIVLVGLLAVSWLAKPWFAMPELSLLIASYTLALLVHGLLFFLPESRLQSFLSRSRGLVAIAFLLFLCFICLFPISSLSLGDGIILYENVALESGLFSFQLTMDEVLTGLWHSSLYHTFFDNPRTAYRLSSTLFGFLYAGLVFSLYRRYRLEFLAVLLLLFSGGTLIYYGYMENYAPVSCLLAALMVYGYNCLQQEKPVNSKQLLLLVLGASIAVLTHFLAACLIVFLIYFCWIISLNQRSFVKNAALSTLFASVILILPLGYFLFFANVRFDLTQTHIAHPPFYPLRRLVSMAHFKQLLANAIFVALPALLLVATELLFYREDIREFFSHKANRLLGCGLLGFAGIAFLQDPMLGFPGDWDYTSLYWFSFSLLAALYLSYFPEKSRRYVSVVVLQILLLLATVAKLQNYSQPEKEKIQATLTLAKEYVKQRKQVVLGLPPEEKKYFAKMDYFLFRTAQQLQTKTDLANLQEASELLYQNEIYRDYLLRNIQSGRSDWKKQLLQELTTYHHRFLKLETQKDE
ncbi:MAG: glycosyltransferase family 39 protein [Spirochaetota bacterium]